ncbi:hypothetical protein CFOL_v3_28421, partial [Cephalotus follicularis]
SYQRLVGRLIYLSHSRPDITFAISMVSQYMHDPHSTYLEAVYRILRYLKSALGRGILFSKHGHWRVDCFTDADWAGCPDDRWSTSGYCTFVRGNLISSRSKKQSVVARSSAEAEFRAMAHDICEHLRVRSLLQDLGLPTDPPMRLYCNNNSAINIVHNPVQHDRTKHIAIDRHFIKEQMEVGVICIPIVQSGPQLADIFTKGLGFKIFSPIVSKSGMSNIYA